MLHENLLNTEKIHLNFNANKIRWLTDSKISSTDTFCIGSGEKAVSIFFSRIISSNKINAI